MQYALLIYSKPGAAEALSADEQEANHREYLDIKQLPGVTGGRFRPRRGSRRGGVRGRGAALAVQRGAG
jgi:hypothetical protein